MSVPIKGKEAKVTSTDSSTRATTSAVQTIAEGKVPSATQIEEAMKTTKQVISEQPDTRIKKDTKVLLDDTERLLKKKNRDGQLQKFIEHAMQIARDIPEGVKKVDTTKLDAEPLKLRGKRCATSLKNLILTLIKSGEFRELAVEMIDLGQGIFLQATEELKTRTEYGTMQPTEHKSESIFDPLHHTSMSPTPRQFESTVPVHPQPATLTTMQPAPTNPLFEDVKSDASTREDRNLRETKEVLDRTTEGFLSQNLRNGKYTTESERRELSRRFQTLINRLSVNEEFRSATRDLLSLLDYVQFMINEVSKETEKTKVVDTEDLRQLWIEAKAIVAEFTGDVNVQRLENDTWDFYTILREDPETNEFFYEFREYINASLENPEKLANEAWRNRGEVLFNWGRGIMQSDRYNSKFQAILRALRDTVNTISNDPYINDVREDLEKLSRDVLLDERGRPSVARLRDAVAELRTWVVPILSKELQTVAIPSIEGSTPKYQYRIDNLVISAKEVMPEKIKLDFETESEIEVAAINPEEVKVWLSIQVKDIATHFKDVRFWVNRTSVPKYEDHGVADVDVDNMSLYLKWKLKTVSDKPWKFQMDKVKMTIGNFKIHIRDAKHDVLDKIVLKLFNRNIRSTIESGTEDYLKEKLGAWNEQLERIVNGQTARTTP